MDRSFLLILILLCGTWASHVGADDAPPGMVWVSGTEFRMGSDEPLFTDARPIVRVWVDGFWMDATEVTNEQFAQFVDQTKYVTVAERVPKAEDFPDAPKENLVAGSIVFAPPDHGVPLDNHFQWWSYVKGASWRHPEGPQSDLKGREKHPVVHIAYEDAQAYAKWAHKRLPTEAEWERAARGWTDQKKYGWGDDFRPAGKHMANTFQGHFPDRNTNEDGFAATAPVKSFPASVLGLYDMAGNVWEWTSDWYNPRTYEAYQRAGEPVVNPHGPKEQDAIDPAEPGVRKRVQKGGSFLCTDQYCSRYMPGGRGKNESSSGSNHVGFRCVMSPTPHRK